jgi:hypothetical protein
LPKDKAFGTLGLFFGWTLRKKVVPILGSSYENLTLQERKGAIPGLCDVISFQLKRLFTTRRSLCSSKEG